MAALHSSLLRLLSVEKLVHPLRQWIFPWMIVCCMSAQHENSRKMFLISDSWGMTQNHSQHSLLTLSRGTRKSHNQNQNRLRVADYIAASYFPSRPGSQLTSSVGKPALRLSRRPPLMLTACPPAACQPSCGLGCCSGWLLLVLTALLGCHWRSPFHQTSQNWTESP